MSLPHNERVLKDLWPSWRIPCLNNNICEAEPLVDDRPSGRGIDDSGNVKCQLLGCRPMGVPRGPMGVPRGPIGAPRDPMDVHVTKRVGPGSGSGLCKGECPVGWGHEESHIEPRLCVLAIWMHSERPRGDDVMDAPEIFYSREFVER